MRWEYIAGFFDGEGSITHNGKGYRITIPQTNREVLEEIQKFVGAGYVFETNKRKEHWKDSWVYYIARQEEVYNFLLNIRGLVIVKRPLVEITIPILKKVVVRQHLKISTREKRMEKAKILREQGYTYRAIGKKLNIDFGYARRLIGKT